MPQITKPIATDETLKRIAEALDAKDTTQERKNEIETLSEEVKNEVRAVGEQVKNTMPEDYSKLSNKVNNLSNALKGSASGTVVSMKDVSPIEHEMKVKASSKNLLPFPYADGGIGTVKTVNGITYTVNDDGSITTKGTSTGYADFVLSRNVNLEAGKSYMISAGVILVYRKGESETLNYYSNYYQPIVWKEEYRFNHIYISVVAGNTVDKTFYPQLEEGTTATEYEPFVDVEDVKLYRTGKNLALINEYTLTGKESLGGKYTPILFEGYLPNKTILSFNKDFERINAAAIIQVANEKGEILQNFGLPIDVTNYVTFTLNAYNEKIKIIVINYSNATGTMSNIQLEVGQTATEYEPFVEPVVYTPNADGTVEGVTSLYPTTTLTTDTAGVLIEAEYNKDINKAYAKQQAEIDELKAMILELTM